MSLDQNNISFHHKQGVDGVSMVVIPYKCVVVFAYQKKEK